MPMSIETIGVVAGALLTAFLVSLVTTPIVKTLAQKWGAVDVPKDGRRMHDHPIPRMGGLAIFLGFLLSVVLFAPFVQKNGLGIQLQSTLVGRCGDRGAGHSGPYLCPARSSEAHCADRGGHHRCGGRKPDRYHFQPQYFLC